MDHRISLIGFHSYVEISGVTGNSITTDYCTAQKKAYGDTDVFAEKGGLTGMGTALADGMALVLSRMFIASSIHCC